MPLNINLDTTTGLKFQQPNIQPGRTAMEGLAAGISPMLQQIPSLMMQYQQLKRQKELDGLNHDVTKQELANKLAILKAQYGTGEPAPATGAPMEGPRLPDASGQEGPGMTVPAETEEQKLSRLGIEGYNALNRNQQQYGGYITDMNGNTKFVSLPSGFKPANMPQAPTPNLIQPTDATGAPIGSPTVIQPGRLTVTKPAAQDAATKEQAKLTAKQMANKPKELKLLNNTEANFDRMIAEAEAIKQDPSLGSALGMSQLLSKIPGTGAKRVASRINTLKSKTGFTVLSEMRASSPTGGALGNVSDTENKMLQENISSLDRGLSEQDFKDSLDRVINYAKEGKQRLRDAFESYYGDTGGDNEKQNVSVKDDPLGLFQ